MWIAAKVHRGYPTLHQVVRQQMRYALIHKCGSDVGTIIADSGIGITGGFLLDVLQGRRSTPEQDIDFIVTIPYLGNRYKELATAFPFVDMLMTLDTGAIDNRALDYLDVNLLSITTTQVKYQFIIHENAADMHRHLKRFDFSFCANLFNVTNVYIGDAIAIATKTCVVSPIDYVRGRVTTSDTFEDCMGEVKIVDVISTIKTRRFEKYRARGYIINVITHVDLAELENAFTFNNSYDVHYMYSCSRRLLGYYPACNHLKYDDKECESCKSYVEDAKSKIMTNAALAWITLWNAKINPVQISS